MGWNSRTNRGSVLAAPGRSRGGAVGVAVEFAFPFPPIETRGPVQQQTTQITKVHTLAPRLTRRRIRPPRTPDPIAQVIKDRIGHRNDVRLDPHARRSYAPSPPDEHTRYAADRRDGTPRGRPCGHGVVLAAASFKARRTRGRSMAGTASGKDRPPAVRSRTQKNRGSWWLVVSWTADNSYDGHSR